MFRSTSLRLAALYTGAFALSVVILGAIIFFTTRNALETQFDIRIRAESAALAQEYRVEGLSGVVEAVHERDRTAGALDYGVRSPGGRPLVGRLAALATPPGWSIAREPSGEGERMRVLTVALPQGYILQVGDDEERIEALDSAVLQGFAWALLGVVLLGGAGGLALSAAVGRRLGAISDTAEAIIDGDLHRRVPVRGSNDDLDRLALTVNRMLDRIADLMESLKQVSSDIAHDLRTPLTRLRNRLEAGLADASRREAALEGALSDLDAILETFAALLRIAQVESGARRAAFLPCDLAEIAANVTEAFAPAAEDQRQSLAMEACGPAPVEGDPELLGQMLANLVENALRHAGEGAKVRVRAERRPDGVAVTVGDDGPGVPEAERARVLNRFYRLERSRTTPGSGLGLALVAAIAKLHGGDIALTDGAPGLVARVLLPAPAG